MEFDEWRVLRGLVHMGAINRQDVKEFKQKLLDIGNP
jgi:hypothetical protein